MREFRVRVADFVVGAFSCHPALRFKLSASFAEFVLPAGQACDLALDVVMQEPPPMRAAEMRFESPTGYAVGTDADGALLIRGWRTPAPPCLARVDHAFRSGLVFVPPARVADGQPFYPLATIDKVVAIHRIAESGGVIVHASGVADRGGGYLFAGPSGIGKSTMAELWSAAPHAAILGEDSVVVTWKEGVPWIHGTPWHENADRCAALSTPLAGVFLLEHGRENRATRCGRAEGAARLLGCCLLPLYDRSRMEAVVAGMDRLTGAVPIYRLTFRPDQDAVRYLQEAVGT